MTKIRLQKLPNDKWYKFGTGKPVKATEEEVALWKSAQRDLVNEFGEPKSAWDRIGTIAKWTGSLAITLTFLVLLMEWWYVYGQFEELGVPQLASVEFLRNPIHDKGVILVTNVLGAVLFIAVMAIVIYELLGAIPLRTSVELRDYVFLGGWIALYGLYWASISAVSFLMKNPSRIINCYFAIMFVGAVYWLFVSRSSESVEVPISGIPKSLILVVTSLFLVMTFVTGVATLLPYALGVQQTREVLSGEASRRPVQLVTNQACLFSNQVLSAPLIDGDWIYGADVIFNPQSNSALPSLQYVGNDDSNLYVLDIGMASVRIIPWDQVEQLVLYALSESAWFALDASFSEGHFLTPTPTSVTTPTASQATP